MRKSVSRNLYLLGIVLVIIAVVLFVLGFQGSVMNTVPNGYGGVTSSITSIGHPGLVAAGGAVSGIAGILILIAWIGALVRTAQLGRWGWFVFLLVLSGITLLIYIFAGPTTPARQPAYDAPYQPQQYPRQ